MNTNILILTLLNILINLLDVLLVILPILLSVAFMTIIERKQLAAHQRRVGPNTTGYYVKETVIPSQSNKILFYLAPVSSLIFSLALSDFSLGILYTVALSSLGIYGVLFAGSLRSTAAMISYELILSSAILIIIILTGSFNFTNIIENQQAI
ncbi:NADH:ubiquinone oxidoreductase [Lactarius hengduanensis]|nr:NADH:ubiquinone oxidoreductase [Lactarius hengduanensis]